MLKSGLVSVAVLVCCVARAQIANGGFETDDFTDWTQTLATGNNRIGAPYSDLEVQSYATSFFAPPTNDNKRFALFNANSGKSDSISQTVTTRKGLTYTLSFYVGSGDNLGKNNLSVYWDGTKEFSKTLYQTMSLLGDTLTPYTVKVSGTGSDTLKISGGGGLAFDNVALAAPEPSPGLWLGLGVGCVFVRRGRRL